MCVGLCAICPAVGFVMILGMEQKLDMGEGYEHPRLKGIHHYLHL